MTYTISCIGFWTFIPELDQLESCYLVLKHSVKTLVGIALQLYWPIFDQGHNLLSISHIGFQTSIIEWNLTDLDTWHTDASCQNLGYNCSPTSLTYIWPQSWPAFFQLHWFLDSHSWIEPAEILLLGTLMYPINILLGIVHKVSWSIFGLGYDRLCFSRIGFRTLISE